MALAKTASTIHVAKGKNIITIDLREAPPDDESLVKLMLGPSGNLRAPTIRKGSTLYVGFHEEAYKALVK